MISVNPVQMDIGDPNRCPSLEDRHRQRFGAYSSQL